MDNHIIVAPADLPITEEEDPAIAAAQQSLEDLLGAMTIDSKKWGTIPGDEENIAQERKIIQEYVKSVGGNDPDAILRNLETSFEELDAGEACLPSEEGKCNLGVLVSQIQLLNTMSRVLSNFEPGPAGYIMESLLSAIFPNAEVVKVGSGTIADFAIGPTNYSLKTQAETEPVKGSVTDLVISITPESPMTYYVFAKTKASKETTDKLTVYKFTITYDNISEISGIKQEVVDDIRNSLADLEGEERDKKIRHFSYKYNKKFSINKTKYKQAAGGAPVATLVLHPVKLLKKAQCELQSIKDQLISIQQGFQGLVMSMNQYLATMSNEAAQQTKEATAAFNSEVQTNIRGDETCDA